MIVELQQWCCLELHYGPEHIYGTSDIRKKEGKIVEGEVNCGTSPQKGPAITSRRKIVKPRITIVLCQALNHEMRRRHLPVA